MTMATEKPYDGPKFMTMFTIVGLQVQLADDADDKSGNIYTLFTKERSEIIGGRRQDGEARVQVCGPVGDSGCEYGGDEAEEIVSYMENAHKTWPVHTTLHSVKVGSDQG